MKTLVMTKKLQVSGVIHEVGLNKTNVISVNFLFFIGYFYYDMQLHCIQDIYQVTSYLKSNKEIENWASTFFCQKLE